MTKAAIPPPSTHPPCSCHRRRRGTRSLHDANTTWRPSEAEALIESRGRRPRGTNPSSRETTDYQDASVNHYRYLRQNEAGQSEGRERVGERYDQRAWGEDLITINNLLYSTKQSGVWCRSTDPAVIPSPPDCRFFWQPVSGLQEIFVPPTSNVRMCVCGACRCGDVSAGDSN